MTPSAARLPRVILIGGAPCSGKSSVGRLLAARTGYDQVCTDDLGAAARAVTTPALAPDLHHMTGSDYRDYYLCNSPAQLWTNAVRSSHGMWPAIAAVVRARAGWGHPAVIEGWALLPELVRELASLPIHACWLMVEPDVLAERIRGDADFLDGAADPEKLVAAFTERSRRYDQHIARHGSQHILRIRPVETVEAICDRVLRSAEARGADDSA